MFLYFGRVYFSRKNSATLVRSQIIKYPTAGFIWCGQDSSPNEISIAIACASDRWVVLTSPLVLSPLTYVFFPRISLVFSCVPLLILGKRNHGYILDESSKLISSSLYLVKICSFWHALLRRYSHICGWPAGLMFNICFYLFLEHLSVCKS